MRWEVCRCDLCGTEKPINANGWEWAIDTIDIRIPGGARHKYTDACADCRAKIETAISDTIEQIKRGA